MSSLSCRKRRVGPASARVSDRPVLKHLRCAAVATALAVFAAPGVASAAVTAPANIISFPARDFVSAPGYKLSDLYTVEVQHPDGRVVGTLTDVAPKDDAEGGGLGIIEVNHPGGYCWTTNTPDIRPGDVVRIKDQTTGSVDESTVRNVTASRPVQTAPGTTQVHGTAQAADGTPLPEAELEQRLVGSSRDAFDVNGKRTIRANDAGGVEGMLRYDAAGSTNCTATYTGLAQADIDRALAAE